MGKRKLHKPYFQCDWTGTPMANANCFMPGFNGAGVQKRGNYINWESVIAHAKEQHASAEINESTYTRVVEHVTKVVGASVIAAPARDELVWFGGTMTEQDFHSHCTTTVPHKAVMLSDAPAKTVELERVADVLEVPLGHHGTQHAPQAVRIVRNKTAKDKELTIYSWPWSEANNVQNASASQAFKMHIYGPAIVVQTARETCFVPRERAVDYTVEQFTEQFSSKRRRESGQTKGEYASVKAEMQASLAAVESSVSSAAVAPVDLAKAAVLPPPLGCEIAAMLDPTGKERERLQKLAARMVS